MARVSAAVPESKLSEPAIASRYRFEQRMIGRTCLSVDVCGDQAQFDSSSPESYRDEPSDGQRWQLCCPPAFRNQSLDVKRDFDIRCVQDDSMEQRRERRAAFQWISFNLLGEQVRCFASSVYIGWRYARLMQGRTYRWSVPKNLGGYNRDCSFDLARSKAADGTGSILLGPERRYLCTDRLDGSTGPRTIVSRQRGHNR